MKIPMTMRRILILVLAAAFLSAQWGVLAHRARYAGPDGLEHESAAAACAHWTTGAHLCAGVADETPHTPSCPVCWTSVGRHLAVADAPAGVRVPVALASIVPLVDSAPYIHALSSHSPRGPPVV